MSTTDTPKRYSPSVFDGVAGMIDNDQGGYVRFHDCMVYGTACAEAAKATGTAGEHDADAEMAKVNRDVELMGVGFLVDGRRCSLDRITWFNRPGDTWLPPPPGYPTEAARQPAPVVTDAEADFLLLVLQNSCMKVRDMLPADGQWKRLEEMGLVKCIGSWAWEPTEKLIGILHAALAATAAPVVDIEQLIGIIRSFGYTTYSQSREIAEALAARSQP